MTAVNMHDRRPGEETTYPMGRQPFSYMGIIRMARANGYPYRFQNGTLLVKSPLFGGGWVPFRTRHAENWHKLYGARLPA